MTFGTELTHFGEKPVDLDLSRHTLITGKSGTGKSNLLANCAISIIRSKGGLLLLDPHGDLADRVVQYIPQSRIRDVIWIDPLAKRVPGLNIFDYAEQENRERAVQSFLTMAKSISGENWGPETERVLNAAADAIVKHYDRPRVLFIHLFLMREVLRKKLLEKSGDPLLRDFVEQYDSELRPSERMSKFSPAINKTDKFLRPYIRTMVNQPDSIDFRAAMDESKIIIARLPMGQLGSITASLIGSVIMAHVSISALQRKENRRPFTVIADEFQEFMRGVDVAGMFGGLRKFGISLLPATQVLSGIPQLPFVFGNCSNLLSFRMGGADAAKIADELGGGVSPESIVSLPDRTVLASLLQDGEPLVTGRIAVSPPALKKGDEAPYRTVIKVSRQRYGTSREEMEKKVMKLLS